MLKRDKVSLLLLTLLGFSMSVIGGIISSSIFGIIFWFIYLANLNELISDPFFSLFTLIGEMFGVSLTIGFPISMTIGISASLHFFLFRQFRPNIYVLLFLLTAGIITAGWLSGFDMNILFFTEISFVGITSILFWYKNSFEKQIASVKKHLFFNFICSVNIATMTFLVIYKYFTFWKYLVDTTSSWTYFKPFLTE